MPRTPKMVDLVPSTAADLETLLMWLVRHVKPPPDITRGRGDGGVTCARTGGVATAVNMDDSHAVDERVGLGSRGPQSQTISIAQCGSSLPVHGAIPIILGALVGTTVTTSLVALTYIGDRTEFRRALGASTVHDFYNWLALLIFFPSS